MEENNQPKFGATEKIIKILSKLSFTQCVESFILVGNFVKQRIENEKTNIAALEQKITKTNGN